MSPREWLDRYYEKTVQCYDDDGDAIWFRVDDVRKAYDHLKEENEKLYAMRGEITKNDARTFGDLMLENDSLRKEVENLKEVLSYLPEVPTEPYEKAMAKEILDLRCEVHRLNDKIFGLEKKRIEREREVIPLTVHRSVVNAVREGERDSLADQLKWSLKNEKQYKAAFEAACEELERRKLSPDLKHATIDSLKAERDEARAKLNEFSAGALEEREKRETELLVEIERLKSGVIFDETVKKLGDECIHLLNRAIDAEALLSECEATLALYAAVEWPDVTNREAKAMLAKLNHGRKHETRK
jgi:hypothetical protein